MGADGRIKLNVGFNHSTGKYRCHNYDSSSVMTVNPLTVTTCTIHQCKVQMSLKYQAICDLIKATSCTEDVGGSEGIAPLIPNLHTRRRWVVSIKLWPIYRRGRSPRYSFGRKVGGPQSRGWTWPNRIPFPCLESNPGLPTRNQSRKV